MHGIKLHSLASTPIIPTRFFAEVYLTQVAIELRHRKGIFEFIKFSTEEELTSCLPYIITINIFD